MEVFRSSLSSLVSLSGDSCAPLLCALLILLSLAFLCCSAVAGRISFSLHVTTCFAYVSGSFPLSPGSLGSPGSSGGSKGSIIAVDVGLVSKLLGTTVLDFYVEFT